MSQKIARMSKKIVQMSKQNSSNEQKKIVQMSLTFFAHLNCFLLIGTIKCFIWTNLFEYFFGHLIYFHVHGEIFLDHLNYFVMIAWPMFFHEL